MVAESDFKTVFSLPGDLNPEWSQPSPARSRVWKGSDTWTLKFGLRKTSVLGDPFENQLPYLLLSILPYSDLRFLPTWCLGVRTILPKLSVR